jgi:tetratricopeptide (TPR) repeat protein
VSDRDDERSAPIAPSAASAAGEGRGLADENREGEGSEGRERQDPQGEAARVPDPPSAGLELPLQTPLFHAQHAHRYARQQLIRDYESQFGCRLAVLIDVIFPDTVTLLEELIYDADPAQDLHLLLDTPGGDGETAVRLVRSAQARCRELTILVPNQAKSAGTLLVMGAHKVLMGPTSDLGPIDRQFPSPGEGRGLYSAKDLIAAVEYAEQAIAQNPDSYPLHVSLLADVTGVMVQQSRSALARTGDLVKEALRSNPDRLEEEVERLSQALEETLVKLPQDHGAVFGAADAETAGLPVIHADTRDTQWKLVWRLWAKYHALDSYVCEGASASQVTARGPDSP